MSRPAPLSSAPPLSVTALSRIIAGLLATPDLRDVWVTGELTDLRASGGHCYMELIDKDMASGRVNARIRAIMWANVAPALGRRFAEATGQRLASGIKVMVRGTVNYHPSFGMSLVISDIDPSYTLGEAERRRRMILARLTADGVTDLNRSLAWNEPTLRIAVVSAPGAAGYGDFVNQLYSSSRRFRFRVELFSAVMQGERTPASCIAALDSIAGRMDDFDCVVMIRGGGSTSDLQSFDDYDLALNVAQFPLPVIVGIGHERDVTVLDYVAAMRVKTPTAAAEWLIAKAAESLDRLQKAGDEILALVGRRIGGAMTQLAFYEGMLPTTASAALGRAVAFVDSARSSLATSGTARLAPARTALDSVASALALAASNTLVRAADRLGAAEALLGALSPEATLRRGFSVTRLADGTTVRLGASLLPGSEIVTTFADGSVASVVKAP